ncbi:MAG: tetratricopeptide repeat protein [candidate division KSB1 bacterium]|nr:tetratricopeptide repeat protein [candidate division KSB1 bacterium]MDZ7333998.1 tetratricopeptide repeat protein [candidate division KSB1 bacterium]MDZ7375247.1 tetratricopeptide repeat protein [candidate division KSB1 bacterium]MDZ7399983.1 tetratricopeptide repeat protein [candidate division KSB1 bacterium]
MREQKPEKAKFELQRAIRLNPKNILAHELLSIIFYRQQRIREAEKHAAIAVSINPKSSRALFVLGAINAKRGRSDLALEQLQTALVALPDAEYRAEARDLLNKIRSQSDDVQPAS